MTPGQYVRTFARFWWLIVVCAVAGTGVSAAVNTATDPLYTSTARVLVSSPATNSADAYQGTILAEQRAISYADFARSRTFAQGLVDELGLNTTAAELQNRIQVDVPTQSSIIRITVDDTDPGRTKLITSKAAAGIVATIGRLEKSRAQGTQLLRARVVGDADVPATAIAPAPWRNPALGVAAGVAVGLALAVVLSRLDRRIRDESAAEETLGVRVLGVLPSPRWRTAGVGPGFSGKKWDESVRQLRTSVYFLHPGSDGCLTLALTSPRPLEQLPQIAGDVAAALVDAGARVLLVQADLHEGAGTPLLGPDADRLPGLADYLNGDSTDEAVIQHHEESGVDVVSAGSTPSHAADLLHSEELGTLVQKAEQHYDYVLITTAATSVGTDAAAVAARCDGVLVVVARRGSRRSDVRAALTQLERVDVPVVGGVFLS